MIVYSSGKIDKQSIEYEVRLEAMNFTLVKYQHTFLADDTEQITPTEFVVALGEFAKPFTAYDIYLLNNSLHLVSIKDQYTVRDGILKRLDVGITQQHKVGMLCFANTHEELVVRVFGWYHTDDSILAIDEPISATAARHYPEWDRIVRKGMARSKILNTFDAHSVLAYMEAQVDTLADVVFALVALTGKEESIKEQLPEYDTIKQTFTDTSVLTVKSLAACLQEMATTKAQLRGLQQDYLAVKQEAPNAAH